MVTNGSTYFFEGRADSFPAPFSQCVGFDAEEFGNFVRGEVFTFECHNQFKSPVGNKKGHLWLIRDALWFGVNEYELLGCHCLSHRLIHSE